MNEENINCDKRSLPKSEETLQKMSDTKLEMGRQKIIEGIDKNETPIQSENKLKIPTHRTKKQISFEQFKELIQNGETLKNLCIIYSKHLMGFYSRLSQGKINLPKELFIEEYEKGVTLEEISEKYDIPREHITYLRDFYAIKRKGAKFQNRITNEKPLSQDAKDVIIGSMLGDGHITKLGTFTEKHSPAQLNYLKWKASHFDVITNDKCWAYYETIDKRSGTLIKSHCFRTNAHSFLYEMRNKFYKEINGKWTKVIPEDIASMINEKVLAIWFMDDGNTNWMYKDGKREYPNAKPMAKLCTESFSEKDVILLINILWFKFGIKAYMGDVRSNGNRIIFDTENTPKLLDITKKYATPDLLYKFDESVYSEIIKNREKS